MEGAWAAVVRNATGKQQREGRHLWWVWQVVEAEMELQGVNPRGGVDTGC